MPLIDYCPDYPDERAAQVLGQCARLRVELPVDDLLHATLQWGGLLHVTTVGTWHGSRCGLTSAADLAARVCAP